MIAAGVDLGAMERLASGNVEAILSFDHLRAQRPPVLLKVSLVAGPAPSSLRPEHPVARSLAQLVSEFELDHSGEIDEIEVSGVSLSSIASKSYGT